MNASFCFYMVFWTFFFSFNNCSLWSSALQRGVQRGLDGSSAAGPAALLGYWSDAGLGRFTGATRLCPGKMALDEQQCSAPPRWRSISLTHVEFPEGMYAQNGSLTIEVVLTGRRFLIFEVCVCSRTAEWTQPSASLPNCEPLSNAERSGECIPDCQILSRCRMRSRWPQPQWRLVSTLANTLHFCFDVIS